jgi:hypothetical protein
MTCKTLSASQMSCKTVSASQMTWKSVSVPQMTWMTVSVPQMTWVTVCVPQMTWMTVCVKIIESSRQFLCHDLEDSFRAKDELEDSPCMLIRQSSVAYDLFKGEAASVSR